MKSLLLFVLILLTINEAYAFQIASLNTNILGKSINAPLEIFPLATNQKAGIIYPSTIKLDFKNNKITAVAMFFSENKISIEDMREIINTRYPAMSPIS